MSNIDTFLKNLGLNEKEVKIFITLLQTGPSTVQNLSKATSISRATIYQRLENLRELGLVVFELGEGGKVVRAVHPKYIKDMVSERVEKSQRLRKDLNDVYPELVTLFQPTSVKAKMLHFEGVSGLQRMIYNYEMEANSKDLYGYTTIEIDAILGKEFIKKYHKKFLEKGYRDHFILSNNQQNSSYISSAKNTKLYKRKRISVRILPQDVFDPKVSVSIYDDKYSIALMKAGKPFGVIIQSEEIADHQREIFNILWEKATPV